MPTKQPGSGKSDRKPAGRPSSNKHRAPGNEQAKPSILTHKAFIAVYLVILLAGAYAAITQYQRQRTVREHLEGLQQATESLQQTTADRAQAYKNKIRVHRNALVDLGYLERKTLTLDNLKVDSPLFPQFVYDLQNRFADSAGVKLDVNDVTGVVSVDVFEHRFRFDDWRAMIDAYDKPFNPRWIPERPVTNELIPLTGRWHHEDGTPAYELVAGENGGLEVTAFARPGWTTRVKNVRVHDLGRNETPNISFDQFFFQDDPTDADKAETRRDPLHGLWCAVSLYPRETANEDGLRRTFRNVNLEEQQVTMLSRASTVSREDAD